MANNSQLKRPTVGFWINQSEGYYQSLLTKSIFDYAEKLDLNLILFDGRNLNSIHPFDHDLNQVFRLTSPDSIDVLLIASNTLGLISSNTDYMDLTELINKIPTVSIGFLNHSIPAVLIDNFTGIKNILQHLILSHHYTKIAFVKGPEGNPDSDERFKAYQEALSESNIPLNNSLIFAGNFDFEFGKALAKKIIKMESVPFEAIVFSNDEMAIAFSQELKENKNNTGCNIAITGFDDIPEASLFKPKLTTIRQPYTDIAEKSFELILSLLHGNSVPLTTKIKSLPIYRESCGCSSSDTSGLIITKTIQSQHSENQSPQNLEKKLFHHKANIIQNIITRIECTNTIQTDLNHLLSALIDMIIFDLKNQRSQSMTLLILEEWMELTLDWDNYTDLWLNTIEQIQNQISFYLKTDALNLYLEQLIKQMMKHTIKWIEYREGKNYFYLHQFLKDNPHSIGLTNTALDKDSIISNLQEDLKKLNLTSIYLVLFENGPLTEKLTIHNQKGVLKVAIQYKKALPTHQDVAFPVTRLLPKPLSDRKERGAFMIMEIFCYHIHFGYILIEKSHQPSISYNLIREEISNALYYSLVYKKYSEEIQTLQKTVVDLKQVIVEQDSLVDNLPFLFLETDSQFNITSLNKLARESLGVQNIALAKPSLFDYLPFEARQKLNSLDLESSKTLEYKDVDIRLQSNGGSSSYPLLRAEWIKQSDKAVFQFIFIQVSELHHKNTFNDDFIKKYRLSKREMDVLDLYVQGYRKKDIASRLFISENTVKGHIYEIFNKFSVKSRSEILDLINEFYSNTSGWNAHAYNLLSRLLSNKQ